MSVSIYCNDTLVQVLAEYNLSPEDYTPAYAGESVGLDLYNAGPDKTIYPSRDFSRESAVLVPTGLHIVVPVGYAGLIRERGSICNTPLKLRAGVIDPGYTDEIFVSILNTSQVPHVVKGRTKLPFQLLVVPVDPIFRSIGKDDFEKLTVFYRRKTGKLGSSDW